MDENNQHEHEVIMGKIDKLESRVNEMDKALGINEVIMERNNVVIDKLSKVMDKFSEAIRSIETTLTDMQNEIRCNSDATTQVKVQVDDLKKKVDEADNKSKIDFIKLIKDNFIGIIGMLYIILHQAGIIK